MNEDRFQMPEIGFGRYVNLYPDKGATPVPAQVLAIHDHSIHVEICGTREQIANVHHIDDPFVAQKRKRTTPHWDYTEWDRRFMDLESQVKRLSDYIDSIQVKEATEGEILEYVDKLIDEGKHTPQEIAKLAKQNVGFIHWKTVETRMSNREFAH